MEEQFLEALKQREEFNNSNMGASGERVSEIHRIQARCGEILKSLAIVP